MPDPSPRRKVAIACQGGGSHAAFTAGFLSSLLLDGDWNDRFELTGLSGTSGGAMCAALAWIGLQRGDTALAGAKDAANRLQTFWEDVKTYNPIFALTNAWTVGVARMPMTAEVSPYTVWPTAEIDLTYLIRKHVGDGRFAPAALPHPALQLLVGATDVKSGERHVFQSPGITDRQLLASAAIPPIFRAIQIGERFYWDGLFATNPPIREFLNQDRPGTDKPDEIWVVHLNPVRVANVPQTTLDIADRRNELSGNLSLAQELYFIDVINGLTAKAATMKYPQWPYKHVEVRHIGMPRALAASLDSASKLDQSPVFIDELMAAGRKEASAMGHRNWESSVDFPISNVVDPK